MSNPFIGEIRMFGGNFAPQGWAFCDGTLMQISQNDTLFNLIGTTYGGDGQNTFALPDLRGRVPIHQGTAAGLSTYVIGENGGVETETLSTTQIPAHRHGLLANPAPGALSGPSGSYFGASSSLALYSGNSPNASLNAAALSNGGGSQPHDNLQPFLCVSFIISLFGVFPTRN